MRFLAFVLATVLIAGCFSNGPSSREAPSGGNEPPVEAAAALPRARPAVEVRIAHSFLEDAETVRFEIPVDAGTLAVLIQHTPEDATAGVTPGCNAIGASTTLIDPSGSAVLELRMEGSLAPANPDCPGAERDAGLEMAPGTWTVEFDGRGTVRALVRVDSA